MTDRSQVLKNLMNMVIDDGSETPSPFKPLSQKLEEAENSSLRISSDGSMPALENQSGDNCSPEIITSIDIF